jgi:cell division protein FtsB
MTNGNDGGPTASSSGTLRDLLPLILVFVLAVVVLAGLAVLPAKTWFSQRAKVEAAEAELARLESETLELEAQLADLSTDEEIELRARKDFDLVYPGEESYRIVDG